MCITTKNDILIYFVFLTLTKNDQAISKHFGFELWCSSHAFQVKYYLTLASVFIFPGYVRCLCVVNRTVFMKQYSGTIQSARGTVTASEPRALRLF